MQPRYLQLMGRPGQGTEGQKEGRVQGFSFSAVGIRKKNRYAAEGTGSPRSQITTVVSQPASGR